MLITSSLYLFFLLPSTQTCGEKIGSATVTTSNLFSTHFDGLTKFHLPGYKAPNAISAMSDGSVWFGEQDVPGIGHLFSNGTLVEFAWPVTYSPSSTDIWGIAMWNGRIWASDALGNQIVGVDPSTLMVYVVRISETGAFPYTITSSPDGSLWFTELYGSKLGQIDAECELTEYALPTGFGGTPTQIAFENATSGYYLDAGNASSAAGSLLSFNTTHFSPTEIGSDGGFVLRAPTSLALVPGGIWVTQHATSALAYYNMNSDEWTQYPTSTVSYQDVTLPYFVAANGSLIWFNEHYANRLAKLDTTRGLLTEYSLSDPPASKIIGIDNALTFAVAKDKVWFTELTANYVGYVDASYQPNFTISPPNNPVIKMKPGENTNLTFTIQGQSPQPLTIQFADTENYTAKPQKIIMTPNTEEITSLNGQTNLTVNVKADETLTPGNYTLLITITNGMITQSAYTHLQITPN